MGFAIMMGNCINCGQQFSFNPHKVPSVRINGKREPVCRQCIEAANPERIKRGLPPFEIHPDAYEPIPEEEL